MTTARGSCHRRVLRSRTTSCPRSPSPTRRPLRWPPGKRPPLKPFSRWDPAARTTIIRPRVDRTPRRPPSRPPYRLPPRLRIRHRVVPPLSTPRARDRLPSFRYNLLLKKKFYYDNGAVNGHLLQLGVYYIFLFWFHEIYVRLNNVINKGKGCCIQSSDFCY